MGNGQFESDSGTPFRFKRHARIGEAAAELDDEFLFKSFLDIGDYQELRDTRTPKRIIVGRTGSGKTALLRYLSFEEEHVVEIDPEHLSLSFISNNNIIRFFESLGVRLDLFYSLLWRHVLAVELIKEKYQLTTEEKTQSWISQFLPILNKKDQAKERALKYLKDWGDKFWVETEHRVTELTSKLAAELEAGLGINTSEVPLGLSLKSSLSEEKKQEIVHRGQAIVNKVQIKELADVIRFLNDDIFTDPQKPYYVTIDKLDENWVDDSLRYNLIRALIEAVRAFQRIENVKIIVALRHDLLKKVFSATTDAVFQEEKYDALILRLRWNREQIETLLDQRANVLIKQQYTSRSIRFLQLFPERVGKSKFFDYFISRTALRPRDAILFVNNCITRSESLGRVTVQAIFEAESEYSKLRLSSLITEWKRIYPSLEKTILLLERTSQEFRISSIDKGLIDKIIEELASAPTEGSDRCCRAAYTFINATSASKNVVIAEIFKVFFEVGMVGLRFGEGSGVLWSQDSIQPTSGQIKPNTKAQIHPMYYQGLHTQYQT